MKKYFYYDKENDLFAVHKGFTSDEKFKGNIDAGHLILDVSTKGRIRGIEVLNAAQFFKDFKIEKEVLETLSDAEFNAKISPSGIILGITFSVKNKKEIPMKIAVPLPVR
jgi:uncharacterized protein YuzE